MSDPKAPPAPNPRLVVWAIAAILAVQVFYAGFEILGDDMSQPLRAIAGYAYYAYAALVVVLLFAVWRRMWWAWHLAIGLGGFGVALTLIQVLAGDSLVEHGLALIIDGGIVVYLLRPNVRAFFEA